ncbi:NAD(P)-binding protein [Lojkania enalia]|uniref:NAD(P)-binding protein n=1 Tax=Lojkania enalia TaxID=147567 RepID=A0A9P4K0E9_9PLEO|nr:NAD(P)-binding protein [Didymosphaeria enalia]
MARILITGSSDGLGLLAAKRLIEHGHSVTLHARNDTRAKDASSAAPGAENVLIGDLSSLSAIKHLAEQINAQQPYDCIIHNAGLYRGGFNKTPEGIPALAAVNTVAPYVLTTLVNRPKRLVFLSSQMHASGATSLSDPFWQQRGEAKWNDLTAYCESKFHNVLFAKAFAKRWPDCYVNALDPGWVATKMGGASAPGDPEAAIQTYVILAEGEEEGAKVSGKYFRPWKKMGGEISECENQGLQEKLLKACAEFSG